MTSRAELREAFNSARKHTGGMPCHYCGQKKPIAMYRLYHLQHDDIAHVVCADCVPRVKKSRVASEWKEWR